jgi:hypothetical protein
MLLFLIMNFLSSRQLYTHTTQIRQCTQNTPIQILFPPHLHTSRPKNYESKEVSGTSASSHQGKWTPQHNHNFQEESLISSRESVAGLASAHEGNGQAASIFILMNTG